MDFIVFNYYISDWRSIIKYFSSTFINSICFSFIYYSTIFILLSPDSCSVKSNSGSINSIFVRFDVILPYRVSIRSVISLFVYGFYSF